MIGLQQPVLRRAAPPTAPAIAPAIAPPLGRPCTGAADDPCAPLRLADGRSLEVRPLRPADAPAEQAFVSALSQHSRYRRFHIGIRELPASLLAQLVEVDQQRHVALAARPLGRLQIVADARYVLDADGQGDRQAAEFALAVADDWQGLGLGRQLLTRLARHARLQAVRQLHGDVLWDNAPMVALVERLGGTLQPLRGEPGVLRACFSAAALAASPA